MTYVHTVKSPDASMDEYWKVTATLGIDRPDGLLARYSGDDDGLVVVTVWESKAHSDRFAAEHLLPAIEAVRGSDAPSTRPTVIGFDAIDTVV